MSHCGWCEAAIPDGAPRRARRVLCRSCGTWSTDPVPGEAELDGSYRGWYRPSAGRFLGCGDAILTRSRGQLAQRLDRISPPGPVLDVGAGDGALLDALLARRREVTGIDPYPSHPLVRAEALEGIGGRWAAIVFWHSLEHMSGAGRALDLAVQRLKPDGVLVISMPNPAGLQARVFGDDWLGIDYPQHLVHVPAPTLLARLESLGLAVERVSYWRGGQVVFGWLHGLVGRLPRHPDLYDAIRRPAARKRPVSPRRRAATLAAALVLLPVAALAAALEIALRRGGIVYVEARHV